MPLFSSPPLGAALAVMFIAWLASLALRDAGVADIAWGLAFVAIALGLRRRRRWRSRARALLVVILVSVWGVRLAGLHRRAADGEDRRYAAMREKHENFALRSLWSVFGTQALIAWVISLPVQVAMTDPTPSTLGVLAWIGSRGLGLRHPFRGASLTPSSGPSRRLRTARARSWIDGLWRYSRHPNYFGEVCVWWGIWLIALETGSAWWTAVGPALLTFLLLRVSGVALTEKTISSRRPGYAEYVRRTSAFVPLPPKG